MLSWSVDSTAMSVPLINTYCKVNLSGRTGGSYNSRYLLVHCEHQHTEVNLSAKVRAKVFVEKFKLKVLLPNKWHMLCITLDVFLTVYITVCNLLICISFES